MPNKFFEYIPTIVHDRGKERTVIEFDTTNELLSHEFFVKHANKPDHTGFAKSGNHILHITQEGFFWWVLGAVADIDSVDFPEWDRGKYRVRLNGEEQVISGHQVQSSCGDIVKLTNGQIALKVREKRKATKLSV